MNKFLRILSDVAESAADDGLIGPTPGDDGQTNPLSELENAEDGGSGWVGWVFIVLGCLILIAGIAYGVYYAWSWFEMKRKRQSFADDPEKQIKHKELDYFDKTKHEKWALNDSGTNHVDDVEVKQIESHRELFLETKFNQALGQPRTIISNKYVEGKNENVYFEVEISSIEEGVDVFIGLMEKPDFNKNKLPGQTPHSFGFSLRDGSVVLNEKELYKAGIKGEFGDTIGLGYTWATGHVWVFHNGTFLNEPSPDSVNAAKDPYEYKKQINDKSEWEKKKKEREAKLIPAEPKHPYHVVLGSTGPCNLMVNIGGAMFRNFNKEIATGLI